MSFEGGNIENFNDFDEEDMDEKLDIINWAYDVKMVSNFVSRFFALNNFFSN